jgi:ribosomal protein S18 acetylase RimI-like enzyme
MSEPAAIDHGTVVRTAVDADLPELQRVFRAASLSNPDDVAGLLAHPEYLVFTGDGIRDGRTRVAVPRSTAAPVLGFATVTTGPDGDPDLEDLFVDPSHRRRGIARRLVLDAVRTARAAGHRRLTVTGNGHALAFYRSVGFVVAGRAETPLGAASVLRLDLAPNLALNPNPDRPSAPPAVTDGDRTPQGRT